MHIRIVTFSLTVDREDYLALTEQVAPAFAAWPGLHAKYWIADETADVYGGVYVFASKEAADASRETDLFHALTSNPAFADLRIVEYGVLSAPTGVTAPAPVRPVA